MDDLEQEFGPPTSTSVVPDHTDESAPSLSPENVRQPDNNNETSFKAAPDKPTAPDKPAAPHKPAPSGDRMSDLSERPAPVYIKRFGHRNEPAVTPVVSHNLPSRHASEDTPPSSPTSSVDIITEPTTRTSDARPSADDRLIDTASDTSNAESEHRNTSDDAVAGHGQPSSNTDSIDSAPPKHHNSIDSDPQKHDTQGAYTMEQTPEGSPKLSDTLAEQSRKSPLRSEASDEAEENEDDDEGDDDNYIATNNRFYTPSSRQTEPLGEDESHSSAAEPKTTHSVEQPSHHPRPQPHKPTLRDPSKQPEPHHPNTGNLAEKLRGWYQQDADRYNEFIAMAEKQCKLQEDKKRLMTENRDLRLEVAHLRSIINGNVDLEQTTEATSENPSLGNGSRLNSPTGNYHPIDSHGGDASFESDPGLPRPPFDSRSYASNANIPHMRAKWQSKEDKKALRIGTKVDDWQEVSRKKTGGTKKRVNPRLNGPNLGAFNKTSPMRNTQALLHNAEGLRVDPPLSKPREQLLNKIVAMNNEQRFCHSDVRGRCVEANCQYRHASEYSLSNEELVALRAFFRRLPCTMKTNCRDGGCMFGHVCPQPADCFKGSKCAWAATHGTDRRPAQDAQNAEELISTAED